MRGAFLATAVSLLVPWMASAGEPAAADRADEAVLARTLYGRVSAQELNEGQSREMVEAARGLVRRQQERVAWTSRMVEEGVLARAALKPEVEELAGRRATLALAEARARLFDEIVAQAKAEQEALAKAGEPAADDPAQVAVRYDGDGRLATAEMAGIESAYEQKFFRPLPVSAQGETAIHRALGFDHRGRVDVALSPDQPEGRWLRAYLESHRIPYFAFRRAVAGKATAAHIHIGPPSPRLRVAD